MAYIRFLGEKTPHKATVIPTNNIVTVKFGTDVIENKNGFDLFLDKECTIDIGGTFYQKFTTIYRNDSVTKKYNGYQLSNDGSVYVEPEISPNHPIIYKKSRVSENGMRKHKNMKSI